ncbi:NGG1p interacting factor 3 [Metschnikowia bicuspidata var. bicuspidata NRRL YB-4993]|uniref:NGG1p interacting factor 3 n=1 Tax=Metschnikowia bicuspidata var. bicuspidata NRRL YB-4993 TaxID=869754 RepID=A0A1A0HIS8_9ASCO|nr:NGG1p interacting factor 3 [Metschnikowia bicuspidata var. bicuspidata NRRL YB-4993]OBA23743.1 NGG1p interacting factor 3 [Metschnikowia bicuspidata var. bicuspidata NRRL YB-4993]
MPSPTSSKTIARVTNAIQKLYPLHLADKSWDNTGLLVDSSSETAPESEEKCKILLTIDLTQSVASEAVKNNSNVVIAYHPFIFRGLKSITPKDPQQKSLLRLIQNNISVYSPHTAVDSAKGGVNDFLADGISGSFKESTREVILPDSKEEGCGMGRLVTLAQSAPLSELVNNVKSSLNLTHVQVATARKSDLTQAIRTIAICAGSGGSVFKGTHADLYFTGELSHHEALYFTETGSSVVACNHTNTERAFLRVLKSQLEKELPEAEIEVSQVDRDPFETW